jgi:hypothetical protein
MTSVKAVAIVMLVLATTSLAQEPITVRNPRNQQWSAADAQEIYRSACLVIQQEFGHSVRPQIVLVLGADKDEVQWDHRELRLKKWNSGMFADGVVLLAFDDLLTADKRMVMTRRTLNWANATVSAWQYRR